jgi:hypothetical protein
MTGLSTTTIVRIALWLILAISSGLCRRGLCSELRNRINFMMIGFIMRVGLFARLTSICCSSTASSTFITPRSCQDLIDYFLSSYPQSIARFSTISQNTLINFSYVEALFQNHHHYLQTLLTTANYLQHSTLPPLPPW